MTTSVSQARKTGQNSKMTGSHIVDCPEIEGSLPCKWFTELDTPGLPGSPMCVNCYAAQLFPMRKAATTGKTKTPRKGLIRLGVYREITTADYQAFLAGAGIDQWGRSWNRPDFPGRPHFVITRGLEEEELYQQMQDNPKCLNIQVSVDIHADDDGTVTYYPGVERLQWFVANVPKALFRFKTLNEGQAWKGKNYGANVHHFQALAKAIGIHPMRVLETPLRINKNRKYQTETPLEKNGWDPKTFLRCNSECGDCPSSAASPGENRVLGCGVSQASLAHLQKIGNSAPKRINEQLLRTPVPWKAIMEIVFRDGPVHLSDIYDAALAEAPQLEHNPVYRESIRKNLAAMVKAGKVERIDRGVYARCE